MSIIILRNKKYFEIACNQVANDWGYKNIKQLCEIDDEGKTIGMLLALYYLNNIKGHSYEINFRRTANYLINKKYIFKWENEDPFVFNKEDFVNYATWVNPDGTKNKNWNNDVYGKNIYHPSWKEISSSFQTLINLNFFEFNNDAGHLHFKVTWGKPLRRLCDYVFETSYFINTMVKQNYPYFRNLIKHNVHYKEGR